MIAYLVSVFLFIVAGKMNDTSMLIPAGIFAVAGAISYLSGSIRNK